MQALAALCFLVLAYLPSLSGDVVGSFQDFPQCLDFFYQGKVPDWGAATPGTARLCQRFRNSYHFATLYDTRHRIAVYSAYRFQTSNGGGREKRWFIEPQVSTEEDSRVASSSVASAGRLYAASHSFQCDSHKPAIKKQAVDNACLERPWIAKACKSQ